MKKNCVTLLLLLLLINPIFGQDKVEKLPNVVIILVDDLGYADVGFNGCKDISTPNIDKIATDGVKFTNAYVSYAVCGPSRAGLITGRYQDRFGFGRNPLLAPNDINQGLPLSEETLAEALSKKDYKSIAVGKWHLGANLKQYPTQRGFTEFFGFLSGGHNYFPEKLTLNDISDVRTQYGGYSTKILHNKKRIEIKKYLTEELTDAAVDFIKRNKDNPFFVYLAYNAPHTPLQATEKYLLRFKNIKNKKRRTYAAMVSSVDDGVGLVLEELKKLNIEENTIIYFLSDNGGPYLYNGSNNGELRDGKGSLYEGGIHVPFAMQWKGHIKPHVYTKPIISLDIFATSTALANVKPKNPIDGVNLIPFLTGQKNNSPHKYLYWRKFDQKAYAVRCDNGMKVVKYKSDDDKMFNLNKDIGEAKELEKNNSKDYRKLIKKYNSWQSLLIDPVFLGLRSNKEYSKKHPDRFKNVKSYINK